MTGKHYNWHKAWTRKGSRVAHISGAEFIVSRGNGFTDIDVAPETLEEYQAHEIARGVPLHDLQQRLMRLAREAAEFNSNNRKEM